MQAEPNPPKPERASQPVAEPGWKDLSSSDRTLATFARMWSSGMVPIIEKSGSWPGFSYTGDEQNEMASQVQRFPNSIARFRVFSFLNAPIAMVFIGLSCLPLAWSIPAFQKAYGSLPEIVFAVQMGAAMTLALGVGLPIAVLITCSLFRSFAWNADLTASDAKFGRRLFAKFRTQAARAAFLISLFLVLCSLWPVKESKQMAASPPSRQSASPTWAKIAVPLAAGSVNLLTFLYYYGSSRKRE